MLIVPILGMYIFKYLKLKIKNFIPTNINCCLSSHMQIKATHVGLFAWAWKAPLYNPPHTLP